MKLTEDAEFTKEETKEKKGGDNVIQLFPDNS